MLEDMLLLHGKKQWSLIVKVLSQSRRNAYFLSMIPLSETQLRFSLDRNYVSSIASIGSNLQVNLIIIGGAKNCCDPPPKKWHP